MDKKMGMEAFMGIGGGTVSEESAKNLKIAEDLCRRRKPEQAVPYLEKALEDPNNLDAVVQLAFLAPTTRMGVQLLEEAEERGRALLLSSLGPACFNDSGDCVGSFWSLLETRPYMRVLQAIVRLAFDCGDFRKSANVMIEMLRLCPGDNLGQRHWLGSVLLKAGRPADALSFAQAWLNLPKDVYWPPRGGCDFRAPSKTPLTKEFIEKNKRGPGAMLYTATLASFKLWGDCEIARQYLRLAAGANPYVLVKILAKVDQPKSLNSLPRSQNGPEEAHDYLWLTQDLWMAPQVWNWADRDVEAKSYVLKTCGRDGCTAREVRVAEFKRCSGCKEAVYCGQACQKEAWPTHRKKCKDQQQHKDLLKAMMAGRPLQSTDEHSPAVASADFAADGIATMFY